MGDESAPRRESGEDARRITLMAPAEDHSDSILISRTGNDQTQGTAEIESVLFKDHRGERTYIFPYEKCRDYESIENLIDEAYGSDLLLGQVLQRNYRITTESGAIILPSAWPSIVRPGSTIQISFNPHNSTSSPTLSSRQNDLHMPAEEASISPRSSRVGSEHVRAQDLRHVPATAGLYDSDARRTLNGGSDSEDSSDATSYMTDTEELQIVDVVVPTKPRQVKEAVDAKGNPLSFSVDTSVKRHTNDQGKIEEAKLPLQASKGGLDTAGGELDRLRITKITASENDVGAVVKIYTLPGPDNDRVRGSTRLTWHHLQGDQLSLSRLENYCLEKLMLSDRLKILTRDILDRIKKQKVKEYVDGFYIEAGSVLRVVEKCQPEPQYVLFACAPYLELQPSTRQLSPGSQTFPPRTLMQAMYPSWQVQDRDEEQAYRKHGNSHSKNLVYMPTFWTMHIGTDIVVTHGHKAIADYMVESVDPEPEDLGQLGSKDVANNTLTTIRLSTKGSPELIWSLSSCRSYLQLEAQLFAYRQITRLTGNTNSFSLLWNSPDGKTTVTPENWQSIISRTDLLSIDLELVDGPAAATLIMTNSSSIAAGSNSVQPFFEWPSTITVQAADEQVTSPMEVQFESQLLETAHKDMLNERIRMDFPTNEVEKAFASTAFYRSLNEHKFEDLATDLQSTDDQVVPTFSHLHHARVIQQQCTSIVAKARKFCELSHETSSLFVSDVNQGVIMRKLWCAMHSVSKWASKVRARGTLEPGQAGTNIDGTGRGAQGGWYIRTGVEASRELPVSDKRFRKSMRRCPRCQSAAPFDSAQAATDHLRGHLEHSPRPPGPRIQNEQEDAEVPELIDEPNLNDWVVQSEQLRREESNAEGQNILIRGCEDAAEILKWIKELSHGVQNEDGLKSELYSFPMQITETFRRVIVFYLAIERALYFTEEAYQADSPELHRYSTPSVLKHFANGVLNSVFMVRQDLRRMASPESPPTVMQNVSLGPEYTQIWLMRRLLFQPLKDGMSIGTIYRKYLSDIQFQVNDRPGKRLIRSINLLQEELKGLIQINKWQDSLVDDLEKVLDHGTYEEEIPSRRAMFPFESRLLASCQEGLWSVSEDYQDLLDRCGPLADQAKQSLEIYEEDHGKAIQAFTIVTVIFLPLSFVTSFFGMNTADVRDMSSGQSLFWAIALPLTFVTIGATMLIGYNGDTLRDFISSTYRQIVNKDRRGRPLRRGRPKQSPENSNTAHHTEPATKLEYEMPKADLVYLSDEEEYIDRYRPVTKLPVERVERISRPTRTQRYTVRIGSEHNFEPVREEGFQTGHFRDEGYQSGRIVEERFETGLLPEYTWERRHRRRRPAGRERTGGRERESVRVTRAFG